MSNVFCFFYYHTKNFFFLNIIQQLFFDWGIISTGLKGNGIQVTNLLAGTIYTLLSCSWLETTIFFLLHRYWREHTLFFCFCFFLLMVFGWWLESHWETLSLEVHHWWLFLHIVHCDWLVFLYARRKVFVVALCEERRRRFGEIGEFFHFLLFSIDKSYKLPVVVVVVFLKREERSCYLKGTLKRGERDNVTFVASIWKFDNG